MEILWIIYWTGFCGAIIGMIGSDKAGKMHWIWKIVFVVWWFLFLIGHHMTVVLEAE